MVGVYYLGSSNMSAPQECSEGCIEGVYYLKVFWGCQLCMEMRADVMSLWKGN